MPKYKDVTLKTGRAIIILKGESCERTSQETHLTTDVFTITFDEHTIKFYFEPHDAYCAAEHWTEVKDGTFESTDPALYEAQYFQLDRTDDDYPQRLKAFIENWEGEHHDHQRVF